MQQQEQEKWDLVIKPKNRLLYINVKELLHYSDLLWLWVRREYVGVYKQTLLGPAWHFLSPIFSTLIYMLVFGRIAKLAPDNVPMFLFFNAGITIWNFFLASFSSTSTAFTNNASIFGKVYFPRLIMPIASLISAFIKFGIQFCLLLVVFAYYHLSGKFSFIFSPNLLLIPIALLLTGLLGFGFGIIVSSITTKYRDLTQLVGFGMQMLMYATPIVYSFSHISNDLKPYLLMNPLLAPVELFKYGLLGTGYVDFSQCLFTCICMLIFMIVGLALFNKAEKNFMDII
ncbi:MAG: ABC transporter permease [Chitinophagaceae bacterium]